MRRIDLAVEKKESEPASGAAAGADLPVPVYRVVDVVEFTYLRLTGNYGSNPSYSGKYFALTLSGARAFAQHPMNAGSKVTQTTLPQSVVDQGWLFIDLGPYGAGSSIYFSEAQLPMVYGVMTIAVIV
jgi:hypothetical protein